jgi:hypothetical protein
MTEGFAMVRFTIQEVLMFVLIRIQKNSTEEAGT